MRYETCINVLRKIFIYTIITNNLFNIRMNKRLVVLLWLKYEQQNLFKLSMKPHLLHSNCSTHSTKWSGFTIQRNAISGNEYNNLFRKKMTRFICSSFTPFSETDQQDFFKTWKLIPQKRLESFFIEILNVLEWNRICILLNKTFCHRDLWILFLK